LRSQFFSNKQKNMSKATIVKELNDADILKPLSDKRAYCHITLSNQLEALLISDPEADKCAAAMDVHVGQFHDTVFGLAHFLGTSFSCWSELRVSNLLYNLEHMLFLGTKKYPSESEYKEFIIKSGGGYNAYTSFESTNYHFSIVPDKFDEALDRFAQFFIAPLFNEDCVEREMKAIESEYAKNLQNDGWRKISLIKYVCKNATHQGVY